jgi:hypothetical protein
MFHSNGKKWSFRISLVTLMISLTLALSVAFLLLARSTLNKVAEQSSDQLFREISGHLVEKVDNLLNSVQSATETGAFLVDTAPLSADVFQGTLLRYMINTLKQNSQIHALFWEDRAGTLVRMVGMRGHPAVREWYGADEKAAYGIDPGGYRLKPILMPHHAKLRNCLPESGRPCRCAPGMTSFRAMARPFSVDPTSSAASLWPALPAPKKRRMAKSCSALTPPWRTSPTFYGIKTFPD